MSVEARLAFARPAARSQALRLASDMALSAIAPVSIRMRPIDV